MDTIFRYYQIESRNIVLFKSILEGYEGLAVVRTVHPEQGIVQLLISPDFINDVETILKKMDSIMRIIPLSHPGPFLEKRKNNPFVEEEGE
jgi:hypothetical protein